MLPLDMKDFLIACTTASASFIGLLFVAISLVNVERSSNEELHTKRILAESSYAALLSIFFICLMGLIPGSHIGYVITIMAIFGFASAGHFYQNDKKHHGYDRALLGASTIIYLGQLAYGISIIINGRSYTSRTGFVTLIIFLLSLALARAWELTGIRGNRNDI